MTVRWFIQTRGPRREHSDYTWQAIDTPDIESGPRYARTVLEHGWHEHGCLSLVDDESEGVLFFDDDRQGLVLLITGLTPAQNPTDFLHRPIRVAVLGTAGRGDPVAWSELTAVAAQALRGGIAESLPITFGHGSEDSAFEINAAAWSDLVRQWRTAIPDDVAKLPNRADTQLRPDQFDNRMSVATKLEAIAVAGAGPLTGRIILLRTNLLSARKIQDLRPWRTLSDVTDKPLVIDQSQEATDIIGQLENTARDLIKATNTMARKFGLLLIGVLVVVGVIVALIRPNGRSAADMTRTFAITDSRPWTATGIRVLAGDRLTVLPGGSIRVHVAGGAAVVVTPVGIPRGTGAGRQCRETSPASDDAADVSYLPCWLLVARIGSDGQPFQVTNRGVIAMRSSGELYLGLNDWCPCVIAGQFTARIRVQPPLS
jgi:hypothetical protein